MDLLEYLERHKIVSIGKPINEKHVASEIIIDDFNGFVEFVIKNGCYISEIRWWDRAKIKLSSQIGYGGTRDPRDPENYYFAETDICASFNNKTQAMEYIKYLHSIKEKYCQYDLYPAFDIMRR